MKAMLSSYGRFAAFLAAMGSTVACAGSPGPNTAAVTGDSGVMPDSGTTSYEGGGGPDEDCATLPAQRPFDARQDCFAVPVDVVGVCRQQVAGVPTTGLEQVCAANAVTGDLFLLFVSTDQTLTGTGWTFGPRHAPDVVHQQSTLSSSDQARCDAAVAATIVRVCASDAGPADNGDAASVSD